MTNENFDKLVKACTDEIWETLSRKGSDYAGLEDRLQNFKDAATESGETPEWCLWMFNLKHRVALKSYLENIFTKENAPASEERWLEVTADTALYLMPLLRGLLIDRGLMPKYAERIGIDED